MPTKQQTVYAMRIVADGIEAGHSRQHNPNKTAENFRKMADEMQQEIDAEIEAHREHGTKRMVEQMILQVRVATNCHPEAARDALIATTGDIPEAIRFVKGDWIP